MAGLVEAFCLKSLPDTSIEFLTALSEEYRLTLEDNLKEEKAHVLRVVVRHLMSPTLDALPDKGASVFLKLYGELGEELQKVGAIVKPEPMGTPTMPPLEGDEQPKLGEKVEVKPDEKVLSKPEKKVKSEEVEVLSELSYHKLRQFKINGTIGDPGQKACLAYSSLCYQIKQGENQGYNISEIYGGVIRAIDAGNPLRELLELEADEFDKGALMKTLRSHFKEKDPNEVLTELKKLRQLPDETAHRFVCRCVALKKKARNMSKAENLPFDDENLSATFFKAVYTGLRQNNVRNEMRFTLREATISDEDLLVEVSAAAANEEERLKKFEEERLKKAKTAQVQKLTCDSDSDDQGASFSSDSSSFSSNSGQNNDQNQGKPSGRKQVQQKKKQNDGARTNQNNANHNGGINSSDFNKMTAAIDKLTASNERLTADVNEMKKFSGKSPGQLPAQPVQPSQPARLPMRPPGARFPNPAAGPQAPVPANSLNPFSPSFPRFPAPRRPYRYCPNCIMVNSSFCNHCWVCGSGDHKIGECPENC